MPTVAGDDALGQAKVTRGARAVAFGTSSTPNATLLDAVDRRRPDDGTMMLLRWDAETFYEQTKSGGQLDDLDPVARHFAQAIFSALLRGRFALRVNESGVVLDISVARPRPLP